MKAFADLADLPEDDRIRIIAHAAEGAIVGFFVDDDVKADRYISKLVAYPVRVIDRKPGIVKGTVMVRVGPHGGRRHREIHLLHDHHAAGRRGQRMKPPAADPGPSVAAEPSDYARLRDAVIPPERRGAVAWTVDQVVALAAAHRSDSEDRDEREAAADPAGRAHDLTVEDINAINRLISRAMGVYDASPESRRAADLSWKLIFLGQRIEQAAKARPLREEAGIPPVVLPSVAAPSVVTKSWAVTVERNGERVVTIETNGMGGRDLLPGDEDVIRCAAQQLLGFIGQERQP